MNNIGLTLTADNRAMIQAFKEVEKITAGTTKDMNSALALVEAQAKQTERAMTTMGRDIGAALARMDAQAKQTEIAMANMGKGMADAMSIVAAQAKRAEAPMAGMGRDMSGAMKQVQDQAKQTGQALGAMGGGGASRGPQQATKDMNNLGMSAKATTAALRQVPMQLTDIVVSLQGGQSPLQVLLQQGGQLKDTFHGVIPAVRALGGYVLSLVNPFSLAAAAIAAVALAFRGGIKEQEEYRKALASTGNAAGVTVDRLSGMAASMDQVAGQTKGQAAEALRAMAATGKVARASLQDYAQTAITAEKVFGQSIETTAKNFAELGKDPVGASKRLNESMNYLTASTYAQIVAAKALGDDQKAATIAQEAYAKGEAARVAAATQNLGYLEKAWKAVTGGALGAWNMMKEAWDWMKNLGREDAVSVQIAFVREELDLIDKGLRNVSPRQRAAREEQLADLLKLESQAKLAGDKQAERVATEKAGIAAVDAAAEAAKKNREAREAAAKKAAEEAMRMIEDGVKLQQSLTSQDSGLSPEFAKQWDNLGKAYKANKISLDQLLEAQKLLLDQQPFAIKAAKEAADARKAELAVGELRNRLVEENAKLVEENAKREADGLKITNQLREESLKPYEQSLKAQQKRVESLEQEDAALAIAEKMNVSLAQAVEMVNIARLEEQKTAARAAENFDAVEILQREIEEREKLVKLIGSKEARDASASAAKKAASDWERASERIQDSLTNALMRGFESGKGFAENLRDTVKNMFNTMVLRPVINAIVGGVTGLGSASASASDGFGIAGNIFSAIKSGGSIIDMITSGTNLAAGMGKQLYTGQIGKMVTQFGSEAVQNMLGKFSAGMMNTSSISAASSAFKAGGAQMAGVVAGSLLNGFAGYGISKALSGGYSAGKGVNVIAGLASMIPGVGPIAGLVGAGVNRLFGRKAPVTTGSGITGTFSASGASVSQYEDWFSKGGTFRSDKSGRNFSAVSNELDSFLDSSLKGIAEATRQYAQILGLNADAIKGVTQSVTISLQGLNADQQQTAITNALTGFGDKMAEQIMGTYETFEVQMSRRRSFGRTRRWTETQTRWVAGEFVREGETAGQALARLAGSLASVNHVLGTLNQRLIDTSLRGGDAASKLLDLFGGLENFTQATGAYYQAFYSETERSTKVLSEIGKALGSAGMTAPTTLAGFRQLVEAQDLNTDAGRNNYLMLMQLAPAFAQATNAMASLGAAANDAAAIAQAAAEAERERAEAMAAAGRTVQEEIRRLRGLDGNTTDQAALQAQFATLTGMARAGDADALAKLPAISQAIEEASRLTAVSALDIARMRTWLSGSLSDTITALGLNVPAFAGGGMHAGGIRLVGENGPELEVTGASRIYSAQQTAAMLQGGGDTASEMRAMREELAMLRAEARATAINTGRQADLMKRVTRNGEAMTVQTDLTPLEVTTA